MTVVLVLCTLLLFLAADYVVQRVRSVRNGRLAAIGAALRATEELALPLDADLLVNHTWTRPDEHGNTILGVDSLLARALGEVRSVLVPEPGSLVTPATEGITLASEGRSLELSSPLPGHVVEVNRTLLEKPALAVSDPYGAGWLMKIRPLPGREAVYASFVVSRPGEWLRSQAAQMREFFLLPRAQPVPVSLQDGGELVEGALQRFDDETWSIFQEKFTTLRRAQKDRGSAPETGRC